MTSEITIRHIQYDNDDAVKMIRASESLLSICIESSYFNWWYPTISTEPATVFPEIATVTLKITPCLHIDKTSRSKVTCEQKDIQVTLQRFSEWLKKHSCPKLQTVVVCWDEKCWISLKHYTGYYDGYDSDGPIPEVDYDESEETLNGNLIAHYFLPSLEIDFSWLPVSVTKVILPGSLYHRTLGRDGLELLYNPLEEDPDEDEFNITMNKYM